MIPIEAADLIEWSGQEMVKKHPATEPSHECGSAQARLPPLTVMAEAPHCGEKDFVKMVKQSLKTNEQTISASSGVENRIHTIYYQVFN